MLGIGLLGTFLSGIGLSMLLGQENTIMAGDRIHAVRLSQRALEAARALRDTDFGVLENEAGNVRGVAIDEGTGVWTLTPEPVTDAQGFRTALSITQAGDDSLRLRAETKWKRGYNRSGSVLLISELTDWRAPPAVGDWGTVIVQGSGSIAGVTPLFSAAALQGDYLFATSEEEDGLYVIDLSSLSNPQLATSVDLGAAGLDLAVRGERLYVLTDDVAGELKVYDITHPALLSGTTAPVTTYNLQREARGRSLALRGDRMLVGAAYDAEEGIKELYLLDIADPDQLALVNAASTLDVTADVLSIAVSGTSALLATSDVNVPIRAADARETSFSLPDGESYNPLDDLPGTHIAAAAGVAMLGRSGIKDLMRVTMSPAGFVPPVVPPDPAPPTHDIGGDVRDLAMDSTACVAFVAVGNNEGGKEFQAVRIGGSMSDLGWLDRDAGDGRVVVYDTDRDRAYMLTDGAWYVLRPGSASLTCP